MKNLAIKISLYLLILVSGFGLGKFDFQKLFTNEKQNFEEKTGLEEKGKCLKDKEIAGATIISDFLKSNNTTLEFQISKSGELAIPGVAISFEGADLKTNKDSSEISYKFINTNLISAKKDSKGICTVHLYVKCDEEFNYKKTFDNILFNIETDLGIFNIPANSKIEIFDNFYYKFAIITFKTPFYGTPGEAKFTDIPKPKLIMENLTENIEMEEHNPPIPTLSDWLHFRVYSSHLNSEEHRRGLD